LYRVENLKPNLLSLNFFFGFQSTFSFFPASKKKNALPSSLQVKDGGSIYIYIAFRIVLCFEGEKTTQASEKKFFCLFLLSFCLKNIFSLNQRELKI